MQIAPNLVFTRPLHAAFMAQFKFHVEQNEQKWSQQNLTKMPRNGARMIVKSRGYIVCLVAVFSSKIHQFIASNLAVCFRLILPNKLGLLLIAFGVSVANLHKINLPNPNL